MLPGPIELLESDPRPAHVPARDADAIDPDGPVEGSPPHAAANDVNRTTANAFFILVTFVYRHPAYESELVSQKLNASVAHGFHHRAHGHRVRPSLHVLHHVAHQALARTEHVILAGLNGKNQTKDESAATPSQSAGSS
jgi:hypothetical protein